MTLDNWINLQLNIHNWAKETFGDNGGNITSTMEHLKEEVTELQQSPSLEEFADCFILLLGAALDRNYDIHLLYAAIENKMEINKKRKWSLPDKKGIIRHI